MTDRTRAVVRVLLVTVMLAASLTPAYASEWCEPEPFATGAEGGCSSGVCYADYQCYEAPVNVRENPYIETYFWESEECPGCEV